MAKTVAGVVFVVVAIILLNVYREGGSYAARSWFAAKFINRPAPRPDIARGRRQRRRRASA